VQAESNTRLPQQLAQVGRGWAALMNRSEVDEEAFGLIRRTAWDSIPPVRRAILEGLMSGKKPHSVGLPPATTDRGLEELVAIGLLATRIVTCGTKCTETEYRLSDTTRTLLVGAGQTNAAPDSSTTAAMLTPAPASGHKVL